MYRLFLLLMALPQPCLPSKLPHRPCEVWPDRVTFVYSPPRPAPVVTGAPYSAEQLQEYTPPGPATAGESGIVGRFARDSQGRPEARAP